MDGSDAGRLLLAGCRRGDRKAWELLLERYGPTVLATLRSRAPREAEDLFQGFWVHLIENRGERLKGADPDRPLGPYLVTIALNLCRREMGRRRGVPLEEGLAPADPSPGPAESSALAEERAGLREALSGLSPRDRLLLTLIEVDGLPHARVAETLGVATDSVSALLGRARKRLKVGHARKRLRERLDPGENAGKS